MKLFGRLLVVTAMLTSVTAFMAQGGAGAGESVRADAVSCAFTLFGLDQSPIPATNVDITLTADDSVAPGANASYTVDVDGEPGFSNGPVPFSTPFATVELVLNGDESNPVTSEVISLGGTIPPNTKITFPQFSGTVGPIDKATTVEVSSVSYFNGDASLDCAIPAEDRAKVTVGVSQSTSSTSSTTSSTTTTTSSTTTSTTSTSSTTSSTTSTTVPEDPDAPVLVPVTRQVDYSCDVRYESGTEIRDQPSPVQLTITAPDRATKDTEFDVYLDIQPGMQNGPVELPANSISEIVTEVIVGAGGSPALVTEVHPPHDPVVLANGSIPVPRQIARVTAAGDIGDEITFKPGTVVTKTRAVPGTALTTPGTVTCTADTEVFGTTEIVEEDLSSPTEPPEVPEAPPTTPTTVPDGGDSTPTTTAAPVTPASSGPKAQVIEQSAQVEFVCNISLGSSTVPPQDDPQTVTIKTVDKVAPGGKLDFQVRFDPGPSTGPIALPKGIENFRIGVVAGGGATPGEVEINVGNVPSRVETNSNIRVPAASGSVTASGADGESVTLSVNRMSFVTTTPQNSTTECTAANAPVITTTAIVEGVEVAAETQDEISNSGGAQLAVTGSNRTSLMLTLALLQLVFGLGLVSFSAYRRRTGSTWTYIKH